MEESIENIWKKGFANDSVSIPKIDNLNSLKSIYFMDKLKSRYQVNIVVLMLTAVLVLFAFIMGGIPFIGMFMFLLFAILAVLGKLELNKLEKINKGDNSHDYVQSIDNWLKALLAKFSLIYRIWVPLLFIGFTLAILKTNLFIPFIGETLIERFVGPPNANTLLGLPTVWLIGIGSIAIFLSFFSDYFFKKEMKSIYGDLIGKLDELLVDLKE